MRQPNPSSTRGRPAPKPAAVGQRDLLALAAVGANDGWWAWDAATNRVFSSARAQQMIGRPAQDALMPATAWLDIVHPEDIEAYRTTLRALMKGEIERFEREYRARRPDGSVAWLLDRAVALRSADGRVYRLAGSTSDISERKAVEQALRDSEQRFRDYAETSADWYWETGPDHRFNLLPDQADLFGSVPATRLRRYRWEVAGDVAEEPEKWREHIATVQRHEPFRDFVYRIDLDSGVSRFVSVSGKPVFSADGRFLGHRGSGRDITETVRAAQALRQAKQEAEAANAAKSLFLANMSHELRTPLNAVMGFSQLLAQEYLGPLGHPRYREYAEDIARSGEHLLQLINDVLDMAKIEAGKLELRPERVSLPPVIDDCLRLVAERARTAGVGLEVAIEPEVPDLLSEEIRLRQIVLNLLTNAIKFTPRGGRVRLSAERETEGGLALRVADTGIGMTAAEVALALQPFQQIDSVAAKRYEGTGLGLPLTKRLVELHGARLDIASAPGQGTTASVRFPAARVLAAA